MRGHMAAFPLCQSTPTGAVSTWIAVDSIATADSLTSSVGADAICPTWLLSAYLTYGFPVSLAAVSGYWGLIHWSGVSMMITLGRPLNASLFFSVEFLGLWRTWSSPGY